MKPLTNLQLIAGTTFPIIFSILLFVLYDLANATGAASVVIAVSLSGPLTAAVVYTVRDFSKNKHEFLTRIASDRLSGALANSVVILWVLLALLIAFLLTRANHFVYAPVVGAFMAAIGVGGGWYLSRLIRSKSLIAYGISFLIALVASMLFVYLARQ